MKIRTLTLISLLAIALVTLACTVPAWVNTVEADAEIAAPIAASLVDVVDPALAPQVTLIENGFNALVKTLDTYKASPTATNLQAVQAAFAAVNSNVAQLESAAQIKSAAGQTKVAGIVQLLAQAVTEIAAVVPANTGLAAHVAGQASPPAYSVSGTPKGWKAEDFKQQFNALVQNDPQFAGKELK
jgi:predicted lipoprotein